MQDNIVVDSGKKWEFNEAVTNVFDEMLKRSIPQYELMRSLTFNIASRFVIPNTTIVDCGCSRGEAARPFIEKFGNDNTYTLIDVSEPMLETCRNSFKENTNVTIMYHDLKNGIPASGSSVVLSILTVQFTPIEHRQRIIKAMYDSLRQGGALIFVEKILGDTAEMDDMLVSEYYRMKSDNQYTQEQIQSKRKSLEGILVPITAKWNEELLISAGFKQVECFWRCLNFAGWVAVK